MALEKGFAVPIIEKIDSIREGNFLIDFRNKILKSDDLEDFKEIVVNIEKEFKKYRNDLFLERQKGSRLINSIGNNALSFVLGSFIPGVGEVRSLVSDISARKFNWTKFLTEIEN